MSPRVHSPKTQSSNRMVLTVDPTATFSASWTLFAYGANLALISGSIEREKKFWLVILLVSRDILITLFMIPNKKLDFDKDFPHFSRPGETVF